MRRAVAVILGLLLVLRGLAGDAMALDMAVGMAPAAPVQHTATHGMAGGMHGHHDHHGHEDHEGLHGDRASASPQAHCCDTSDGGGAAHADHQTGCTACGACHCAFSAPAWAPALHERQGGALQPHHGARFASATAAQAIKPPIA